MKPSNPGDFHFKHVNVSEWQPHAANPTVAGSLGYYVGDPYLNKLDIEYVVPEKNVCLTVAPGHMMPLHCGPVEAKETDIFLLIHVTQVSD